MRGLSLIVLALIGALVVGLGVLALHPPNWMRQQFAFITGAAAPATPSAPTDRPSPLASPKPAAHEKPSVAKRDPLTTEAPEPRAVANNPTVALAAPFPGEEDIPAGMAKAEILSLYGTPGAAVTGADSGRLQERLVYSDKGSRKKTIIVLQNGKAVAAHTFTE